MGRPLGSKNSAGSQDSNANVSTDPPVNPDFNESGFVAEVVDRKENQVLSAKERKSRSDKAYRAGLKLKAAQAGQKQTQEEIEAQKAEDEKFRTRCFAPGVLKTVAALYKYGVLFGVIIGFKLFKIPSSYMPEKHPPMEDADAWSYSLVDWMCENLGPAQAYRNLTLVCLFGLPCVNIGQAVTMARLEYKEDQKNGIVKQIK